MEYLKVAEGRASPKREFRYSRARNQRSQTRSNILDATTKLSCRGVIVSGGGDDGKTTRMKIVVKKQDLKQMLEVIRVGNNATGQQRPSVSPPQSLLGLEQRLNLMKRRQQWRATGAGQVKGSRRSSWRPALQSIPEELQA
ncbi:hypothetical protein U1Q18_034674 [Sarracenia purpurea var. burkii]